MLLRKNISLSMFKFSCSDLARFTKAGGKKVAHYWLTGGDSLDSIPIQRANMRLYNYFRFITAWLLEVCIFTSLIRLKCILDLLQVFYSLQYSKNLITTVVSALHIDLTFIQFRLVCCIFSLYCIRWPHLAPWQHHLAFCSNRWMRWLRHP